MKLARLAEGPEVFFSLQGEGKHQGRPSVFVRTSRCNLHCAWCDTPYTWNWKGTAFRHDAGDDRKYDRDRETVEASIDEIANAVAKWPCRNVVLTGGEPLLQAEECASLSALLHERDPAYAIEIETNGTLAPSARLQQQVELFTVSPKLAHCQVPSSLRLKAAALSALACSPKSVFKFVIKDESDLSEVTLLAKQHAIASDRIYLMPEGIDAGTLAARRKVVAELCLTQGYHFSDRLHIHLYGNQPGV